MKCHEYTIYGRYDTAGNPLKGWRCYCGTTACLENNQSIQIQNLAELETISYKKTEDCDCEFVQILKNGLCEKCERKFYEHQTLI